jgi:xanthine dehydrogenase accessory factor
MIRGLKLSGTRVGSGHKVGDVDPRCDRALLAQMTDKARGVGAGVLRALEESD